MKRQLISLLILLFCYNLDAQTIATFAGNGICGNTGDGTPATAASIYGGYGAFDRQGNYYFAEGVAGQKIRKINSFGIISTIAGTGIAGFSGEDGLADTAMISNVCGVAVDSHGNLYLSDAGNRRIRKIDASTGIIHTIAGNGACSFSGEGVPATTATICAPYQIIFDAQDNLYFGDAGNHRVRKIDTNGIITTIAGNGTGGATGDGGQAISAELSSPISIAFNSTGDLYIGDNNNKTVRKIDAPDLFASKMTTTINKIRINKDSIIIFSYLKALLMYTFGVACLPLITYRIYICVLF